MLKVNSLFLVMFSQDDSLYSSQSCLLQCFISFQVILMCTDTHVTHFRDDFISYGCSVSLYEHFCWVSVLTINPNWSTYFTGESVTFICKDEEGTDGGYKITRNGVVIARRQYPHNSYTLQPLDTSSSGDYKCCGLSSSHETECSKTVNINVSGKCFCPY